MRLDSAQNEEYFKECNFHNSDTFNFKDRSYHCDRLSHCCIKMCKNHLDYIFVGLGLPKELEDSFLDLYRLPVLLLSYILHRCQVY